MKEEQEIIDARKVEMLKLVAKEEREERERKCRGIKDETELKLEGQKQLTLEQTAREAQAHTAAMLLKEAELEADAKAAAHRETEALERERKLIVRLDPPL